MASEDDDFDDDEAEADITAPVFNEYDELEEPSYAAAGTMALGNEDIAGKKRKRRPKGPAPLDAEGFPKHWDEDRGEWVEGVGVEATGPAEADVEAMATAEEEVAVAGRVAAEATQEQVRTHSRNAPTSCSV